MYCNSCFNKWEKRPCFALISLYVCHLACRGNLWFTSVSCLNIKIFKMATTLLLLIILFGMRYIYLNQSLCWAMCINAILGKNKTYGFLNYLWHLQGMIYLIFGFLHTSPSSPCAWKGVWTPAIHQRFRKETTLANSATFITKFNPLFIKQ